MRIFAFNFILLFISACNYKLEVDLVKVPLEDLQIIQIKLVDSLGHVSITLPTRYDTSFYWTDYSDCGKPCNTIKYRSQSSSLPITKESGWIWLSEPKDSIERFTVFHSGYFPFHNIDDSSFISKFHQHHKEQVLGNPDTYKINSDTLEKIHDKHFSIISIDLYDTTKKQFYKKLSGATIIKGNIIYVDLELLTKKEGEATDNFIENSKYYLRTIKLNQTFSHVKAQQRSSAEERRDGSGSPQ